MPRPPPVSRIDTRIDVLHFLMSALTIFVGVCWRLFHRGFKGVAQMAKVIIYTTSESGGDTDRATMLVDSGASRRYFDDELHPGLKDKLLNCM